MRKGYAQVGVPPAGSLAGRGCRAVKPFLVFLRRRGLALSFAALSGLVSSARTRVYAAFNGIAHAIRVQLGTVVAAFRAALNTGGRSNALQ